MTSKPRRTAYWLQLTLTLAVCAFMTVPVVLSVLAGLTNNIFVGLSSGLTTRWLVEVWSLYRNTIFLSLGIALACLACTLVIGVPAAYYMALRRNRVTRLIEELLMLPVAVPGLATALGLILLYGGWQALRTSWVFILIGHVLFTLPFMVRSVLAILSAIDIRTIEDAAASLGATRLQRFFTVVLPNCRQGILAGALMVATGALLWAVKTRQSHAKRIAAIGRVPFGLRLVEALNLGVIAGLPIAFAAYFWANRLLPADMAQRSGMEIRAFFSAWAVAAAMYFQVPS